MSEVFEFDVTMTVRRRMHLSGPASKEIARQMLTESLKGGMAPSIFSKRDSSGHFIEQILSNDIDVQAVSP